MAGKWYVTFVLLALDTSTAYGSLALLEGRRVRAELSADVLTKHETTLLGRIDSLLALAAVEKRQLTALAVGTGPGGFTSVRVGIATVKGLALALSLPVVGVSSLRALARTVAPGAGVVATLTDAHRGELFAALYMTEGEGTLELAPPMVGAPDAVAKALARTASGMRIIAAGDGLVAYPAVGAMLGEETVLLPDAKIGAGALGLEAETRLRKEGPDTLSALLPTYVRGADAKLPDKPLDVTHAKT